MQGWEHAKRGTCKEGNIFMYQVAFASKLVCRTMLLQHNPIPTTENVSTYMHKKSSEPTEC